MKLQQRLLLTLILSLCAVDVLAKPDIVDTSAIDFVHYKAEITPSFSLKSIQAKVVIEFVASQNNVNQLVFSAKYKTEFKVASAQLATVYQVVEDELIVTFAKPLTPGKTYFLSIAYQAAPQRGMRFYPDHLFSVYHTNYWLVSHNNINDKASFELLLTHNKNMVSISNGKLVSQQALGQDKMISHWQQLVPMPLYTLGFALGKFDRINKKLHGSSISYLYRAETVSGLNPEKVNQVFNDVADMLAFFEQKSGVALPGKQYTYILAQGSIAQEATGYSLVGEKLAHTLLEDVNENWFIAHELAHEWWGNSITCANFSHFWLNEGLVQFLVAAYKEHLFGQDAYKNEIQIAIDRVARAVKKGRNGPVAFHHVIAESEINRTMVYSKGALVFYMLRTQLGDEHFWQAIKQYSIANQGGSVTSQDLKQVFEQVSGQDLTNFFQRWVYGDQVPQITL